MEDSLDVRHDDKKSVPSVASDSTTPLSERKVYNDTAHSIHIGMGKSESKKLK